MAKHALAGVEGFIGTSQFFKVDPKVLIIEDGFNPREKFGDVEDIELKNSINENGVQIPLKVQKTPEGNLKIRDGGRRHWACMQLINEGVDIKSVPVMLIDKNTTDDDGLFLALITNTGKPFKPYEEAKAFQRLKSHGHSVADIARRIGKTQPFVYERLRLINMTTETKQALEKKQITIRDAAGIAANSGGNSENQKTGIEQARKKLTPTQKFNQLKELVKTYIEYIDISIADYHNPWPTPDDVKDIREKANQVKSEIQALLEE